MCCNINCEVKPGIWFFSVLFGPGEGTTCVPLEELLQADIGTSLVQCINYFMLVNHGGTKDHSSQKINLVSS